MLLGICVAQGEGAWPTNFPDLGDILNARESGQTPLPRLWIVGNGCDTLSRIK